jgi:integrase
MDGLIPPNATEAVKPLQPSREEMRPLTPEQAKILLRAAHEAGDRLEALYVLAVHTGLRQGELLGLKWDDVDLEDGSLQVRCTLTITKNGLVFTSPKTAGSRRSVKLTGMATDALKSHLERQLGEIDRVGSLWSENGLIFASETGDPLGIEIQAPTQARRVAGDPVPRSPPHLRHVATHPQRESQDSVRDAWTFDHRHHPRHLLPRAAEHARCGRGGDGRGPIVVHCCRIAAKAPGIRTWGLFIVGVEMPICSYF